MLTNEPWIGFAIMYLLTTLLISVQIYFGQSNRLFGVSIPTEAEQDRVVRRVRWHYTIFVWVCAVIIAGVCFLLARQGDEELRAVCVIIAMLLQVPIMIFGIQWGRRSASRLKEQKGWHVPAETKRVAMIPIGRPRNAMLSIWWFGVHLAIIAACVVIAIVKWDQIPDTLIAHYDLNGVPDRYASKTVGEVFLTNLVQVIMLGIFVFINLVIGKARNALDPNEAEASLQRNLKFKRVNSIFIWFIALVMIVFMGLIQAMELYGLDESMLNSFGMLIPVIIVVSLLGMMIYLKRKGLDQQRDPASDDERHWRIGGGIYYNPDDPALFVPKRYGLGWTINFARPMSWVLVGCIAGIPVIIAVVSLLFGK